MLVVCLFRRLVCGLHIVWFDCCLVLGCSWWMVGCAFGGDDLVG